MKIALLTGKKIQPLDSQVNLTPSTIPKPSFIHYIAASRGSGKTVALINLLINKEMLADKFNQIYFVSPTASLDSKLNILKTTPGIIAINHKLINAVQSLQGKRNKSKAIFDGVEKFKRSEDSVKRIFYETSIPEENFISNIDSDASLLDDLIKQQRVVITKFGKDFADKILIIYDDCISSRKYFKSESFQKAVFNSRHFNISIIITSQAYNSLPKSIRLNCSFISVFYTGNKNERKIIYEENSSGISFKEFEKVYLETCNKRPFNFLSISYQNPPSHRLIDAFEDFILV